jgi:hypothetical protein
VGASERGAQVRSSTTTGMSRRVLCWYLS